jgi:hypothetical protein
VREKFTPKSILLSLSRYTIVSEFTGSVNSVFTKVAVFLHICETELLRVVNSTISSFSRVNSVFTRNRGLRYFWQKK